MADWYAGTSHLFAFKKHYSLNYPVRQPYLCSRNSILIRNIPSRIYLSEIIWTMLGVLMLIGSLFCSWLQLITVKLRRKVHSSNRRSKLVFGRAKWQSWKIFVCSRARRLLLRVQIVLIFARNVNFFWYFLLYFTRFDLDKAGCWHFFAYPFKLNPFEFIVIVYSIQSV